MQEEAVGVDEGVPVECRTEAPVEVGRNGVPPRPPPGPRGRPAETGEGPAGRRASVVVVGVAEPTVRPDARTDDAVGTAVAGVRLLARNGPLLGTNPCPSPGPVGGNPKPVGAPVPTPVRVPTVSSTTGFCRSEPVSTPHGPVGSRSVAAPLRHLRPPLPVPLGQATRYRNHPWSSGPHRHRVTTT